MNLNTLITSTFREPIGTTSHFLLTFNYQSQTYKYGALNDRYRRAYQKNIT